MATVNKDFKIKSGLVVEGSTATVGGFNVLTKKQDDQDYIVGLIGGTATSANTANTVVKRDASGNFAAGTITAGLTGNASTATTLATARTIAGQSFDGSANVSIAPTDLTGVTATAAEINLLDGVTATTAELNILDGVTATASELNILDGVTASTAELNFVDGVTSAIQDQINAKAPSASPTFTGTVSGVTATHVGLGNVDNTSDANKPVSTATQTALDLKAPLASPALTGTPTAPTATVGTNTTQVATTAFVGSAVAALIDAAPETLNTLNELAAAISDDANFATTLTTSVGTKVSKAGDTMTGLLVLSADPSANLGAATKQYVDTAESDAVTAAGTAAGTAISNAVSALTKSSVGLANVDNTSDANKPVSTAQATAIAAALTAAEVYADALDTDDVAEATSLYFTDARAKSSAADLLTGATKTNITITGSGTGLTITAENGVADSTTSDLTEGTNKYFTDARAVTALEAVVPNFTAVELNSVAKQVAATLSAPTAGVQTAHAFAKADYRSAEYLVKIANGNHTEISKVLLTLDSTDGIAITEYGIVGTNGSLATVSAGISGANVQLLVTTANNTSTVTVVGTLLA
jgi:hypothetical protein